MKIDMRITATCAALCALAFLAGCGGKEQPEEVLPEIRTNVNLVVNPGFEEWEGFMPAGWELRHFSGDGEKRSYFGKSEEGAEGRFSYYLRGLFDTGKWMVLTQRHPVRPGHEILFAADIRTRDIKRERGQEDNANIYVRFYDAGGNRVSDRYYADAWTRHRLGTSGWRRNEEKVEVPEKARSVEIGLINQMTGYIYFDNVELVILEPLGWEERATGFITFKWLPERPFPAEAMEAQAKLIEEMAREAGVGSLPEPITFYLYPSEEAFMRILDRKKYKTAARWDRRELHAVETFNDHEIIHLLLYDLGFPPVGLAKGLVFYFRAKHNEWDLHVRSKRFLMQQRLPALYHTIDPEIWREADQSILVPGWGSFVTWLIDRYGIEKLLDLYGKTNGVEDDGAFSARFKDIYGLDFQETDRNWRIWLLRYQGDPAADTLPDEGD
ncbi:MAG: hypothetical protein PHQ19_09815 [Candidatus Krumholzibacteria bacterium]|nr:hypothetical protein [Candidatus Krumholzibacteria bacterium]